mgnify:CR=1 FL=1
MSLSNVQGSAVAGAYDFKVSQLAQNQRVMSDQYTSKTQVLNSSMKDAVKIFDRETKRWAKRTKQFGILGR